MIFFYNSYNSIKDLCDHLRREGFLKSKNVEDALMNIVRADYINYSPYEDRPQSINYNINNICPTFAYILFRIIKRLFKNRRKIIRCWIWKWLFNGSYV